MKYYVKKIREETERSLAEARAEQAKAEGSYEAAITNEYTTFMAKIEAIKSNPKHYEAMEEANTKAQVELELSKNERYYREGRLDGIEELARRIDFYLDLALPEKPKDMWDEGYDEATTA